MPKAKKATKYCIAAGCRNNDQNWKQPFFSCPSSEKDSERCRQWLTLLGREDLIDKISTKWQSYRVCSAHFDSSSMTTKTIQVLKKDTIPSMLLANSQPAVSTQKKETKTVLSKTKEVDSGDTEMPSTSAKRPSTSAKMPSTSAKLPSTSAKMTSTSAKMQDKGEVQAIFFRGKPL